MFFRGLYFGLFRFKDFFVIFLNFFLFVAEPSELSTESGFVVHSQISERFENGKRNAVATEAAIRQRIQIRDGHSDFRSGIARTDFSAFVIVGNQFFRLFELVHAFRKISHVEVHAAGFETPHNLIAGIDHRTVIPLGLLQFFVDLRHYGHVVGFRVCFHHRGFLAMGIDHSRTAGKENASCCDEKDFSPGK